MPGSDHQEKISGPLCGITVVAVEQAVAVPFATRQLADLGARVIKVERPGGGDFARAYDSAARGLSSHFAWLNRGKQSVVLDLKNDGDLALLRRMIALADVFVQNLRPDAANGLGLGHARLRAAHPRLIYCTVSGYGSQGPFADRKAYDLMIQAESGLLSITGSPDEPAKVGIAVADIAAGMYAYSGILTALYQREHTGTGSTFEVAMLDALAEWMTYPYYYALGGRGGPQRSGARHATIAPYGPFPVGDGTTVYLAVQNAREWRAFCATVIDRPELTDDERFATNPLRIENHADLEEAIRAAFADCSGDEVRERLEQAGIANAMMRSVPDLADHPQLLARGRWRAVDSPVGKLPALLPPVTSDAYEAHMGAIPVLGADTEAIRREFGTERTDAPGSVRPVP